MTIASLLDTWWVHQDQGQFIPSFLRNGYCWLECSATSLQRFPPESCEEMKKTEKQITP